MAQLDGFDFDLLISHEIGVEEKEQKRDGGEETGLAGIYRGGSKSNPPLQDASETQEKAAGIHEITGC